MATAFKRTHIVATHETSARPGYGDADDLGFGAIGNPIGAPGIPAVESGVNLGRPINRHGLR